MQEFRKTRHCHFSRSINSAQVEDATGRQYPWYQVSEDGKRKQYYAVCPGCDNPIRIIGLYSLSENPRNPYGKHASQRVPGFDHFDPEEYMECPYYTGVRVGDKNRCRRPTQTTTRIRRVLIENFDRVILLLQQDLGLKISLSLAEKMLRNYLVSEGHLYIGATLSNIPWIFAYMSDSQTLFGQTILENEELESLILENVPHAKIDGRGKITKGTSYYELNSCFVHHAASEVEGLREEYMSWRVTDESGRMVMSKNIKFRPENFIRLSNTPPARAKRNQKLLDLANEVLNQHLRN